MLRRIITLILLQNNWKRNTCFLFLMLITSMLFAGCSLAPSRISAQGKNLNYYQPATLSPTIKSDIDSVNIVNDVAIIIDCDNNLEFIDDVTIPDGTIVSSGDILDKIWQVKNSGTCNWDDRYSLRLTAGNDLNANPIKSLFPARSGTTADISIQFIAPEDPGIYRSAWQAFDPENKPFGDPFYIEFVVESK